MRINRLDVVIMKILKKNKCINFLEGMTLQEIMEVTETSRPTTYRKLINLCELGYVDKGCKAWNADTFYLSEKGIHLLEGNGGKENA